MHSNADTANRPTVQVEQCNAVISEQQRQISVLCSALTDATTATAESVANIQLSIYRYRDAHVAQNGDYSADLLALIDNVQKDVENLNASTLSIQQRLSEEQVQVSTTEKYGDNLTSGRLSASGLRSSRLGEPRPRTLSGRNGGSELEDELRRVRSHVFDLETGRESEAARQAANHSNNLATLATTLKRDYQQEVEKARAETAAAQEKMKQLAAALSSSTAEIESLRVALSAARESAAADSERLVGEAKAAIEELQRKAQESMQEVTQERDAARVQVDALQQAIALASTRQGKGASEGSMARPMSPGREGRALPPRPTDALQQPASPPSRLPEMAELRSTLGSISSHLAILRRTSLSMPISPVPSSSAIRPQSLPMSPGPANASTFAVPRAGTGLPEGRTPRARSLGAVRSIGSYVYDGSSSTGMGAAEGPGLATVYAVPDALTGGRAVPVDEVRRALCAAQARAEASAETAVRLQLELAGMEQRILAEAWRAEEAEAAATAARAPLVAAEAEIRTLRLELDAATSKLSSLVLAVEQERGVVRAREDSIAALQQGIEEYKAQVDTLSAALASMGADCEAARQTVEARASELSAAHSLISDLKRACAVAEASAAGQRGLAEAAAERMASLQGKLESACAERDGERSRADAACARAAEAEAERVEASNAALAAAAAQAAASMKAQAAEAAAAARVAAVEDEMDSFRSLLHEVEARTYASEAVRQEAEGYKRMAQATQGQVDALRSELQVVQLPVAAAVPGETAQSAHTLAQLSSLTARVTFLSNQVAQVEGERHSWQGRCEEAEGAVQSTQVALSAVTQAMRGMQAQVAALTGEEEAVVVERSSSSAVNGGQAQGEAVAQYRDRVLELEATLSALQAEHAGLQAQASSLSEQLSSSITHRDGAQAQVGVAVECAIAYSRLAADQSGRLVLAEQAVAAGKAALLTTQKQLVQLQEDVSQLGRHAVRARLQALAVRSSPAEGNALASIFSAVEQGSMAAAEAAQAALETANRQLLQAQLDAAGAQEKATRLQAAVAAAEAQLAASTAGERRKGELLAEAERDCTALRAELAACVAKCSSLESTVTFMRSSLDSVPALQGRIAEVEGERDEARAHLQQAEEREGALQSRASEAEAANSALTRELSSLLQARDRAVQAKEDADIDTAEAYMRLAECETYRDSLQADYDGMVEAEMRWEEEKKEIEGRVVAAQAQVEALKKVLAAGSMANREADYARAQKAVAETTVKLSTKRAKVQALSDALAAAQDRARSARVVADAAQVQADEAEGKAEQDAGKVARRGKGSTLNAVDRSTAESVAVVSSEVAQRAAESAVVAQAEATAAEAELAALRSALARGDAEASELEEQLQQQEQYFDLLPTPTPALAVQVTAARVVSNLTARAVEGRKEKALAAAKVRLSTKRSALAALLQAKSSAEDRVVQCRAALHHATKAAEEAEQNAELAAGRAARRKANTKDKEAAEAEAQATSEAAEAAAQACSRAEQVVAGVEAELIAIEASITAAQEEIGALEGELAAVQSAPVQAWASPQPAARTQSRTADDSSMGSGSGVEAVRLKGELAATQAQLSNTLAALEDVTRQLTSAEAAARYAEDKLAAVRTSKSAASAPSPLPSVPAQHTARTSDRAHADAKVGELESKVGELTDALARAQTEVAVLRAETDAARAETALSKSRIASMTTPVLVMDAGTSTGAGLPVPLLPASPGTVDEGMLSLASSVVGTRTAFASTGVGPDASMLVGLPAFPDLEVEHDSMKVKVRRLEVDLQAATSALERARASEEARVSSLQDQISRLVSEVGRLRESRAAADRDRAQAEAKVLGLQAEIVQVRNFLSQTESLLADAQASCTGLQVEVSTLSTERDRLAVELRVVRGQLDSALTGPGAGSKVAGASSLVHAATLEKLAASETALRDSRKEIARLTESLERAHLSGASRVGGMPTTPLASSQVGDISVHVATLTRQVDLARKVERDLRQQLAEAQGQAVSAREGRVAAETALSKVCADGAELLSQAVGVKVTPEQVRRGKYPAYVLEAIAQSGESAASRASGVPVHAYGSTGAGSDLARALAGTEATLREVQAKKEAMARELATVYRTVEVLEEQLSVERRGKVGHTTAGPRTPTQYGTASLAPSALQEPEEDESPALVRTGQRRLQGDAFLASMGALRSAYQSAAKATTNSGLGGSR